MSNNKSPKTNQPNEQRRDQPPCGGDAGCLRGQGHGKGELLLRAWRGDRHARPPGGQGRPGLTKAIKDDIADPNLKITVSNEKTEVASLGDMAYRRGSFKITMTNPQTKRAEQSEGTYLAVFRKQADGSWKIAEDFGV